MDLPCAYGYPAGGIRGMFATIRKSVLLSALLVLVSCVPVVKVSFFNGSGSDLFVITSDDIYDENVLEWEAGKYLIFKGAGSTVIGEEFPYIFFEVVDRDGWRYKYSINRSDVDYFQYVWSGRQSDRPVHADVSDRPRRACVQVRIEQDMLMYLAKLGCSSSDLQGAPRIEQPEGFPISPVVSKL